MSSGEDNIYCLGFKAIVLGHVLNYRGLKQLKSNGPLS